MRYACCTDLRRDRLRQSTVALNGIDFLEVRDDRELPDAERQRTLEVHFVKDLTRIPKKEEVRIEGGERVRHIRVIEDPAATEDPNVISIRVDRPGDFSTYTLRFVSAEAGDATTAPSDIDPITAAVEFSFKVACPSDFDCAPATSCPPELAPAPAIDYLAKDYEGFRRLMIDRLATLLPGWKERNPADVGIALVETLAYVADYLSYAQDAVATEAYLGTARRRVSVRRHARLVDYPMHDGCNARAWVQIRLKPDAITVRMPRGAKLLVTSPQLPPRVDLDTAAYREALADGALVFETMYPVDLYGRHNELPFYTWEDQRCCLPRGATSATLKGHVPDLKEGQVLVLREVKGPNDGDPASADPAHRHAVRLIDVRARKTASTSSEPLTDPLTGTEITEIAWADADALPFPLCISAETDEDHGQELVEDVSVALGNIVLVDHGRTIAEVEPEPGSATGEPVGVGPMPGSPFRYAATVSDPCRTRRREAAPPRHRILLREGPVTQAAPLPGPGRDRDRELGCTPDEIEFDRLSPATAAFRWEMSDVLPEVMLTSDLEIWRPARDLLGADPFAQVFVVEVENDGRALIRFGDDRFGARPRPGARFYPSYRIGNGSEGNVGAGAIRQLVVEDCTKDIAASLAEGDQPIANPMPARGGRDPEPIEEVRQRAPVALREQARAVTPEDYARIAGQFPGVQRAVATFRWTGSWRTVFLTVDRLGGGEIDETFESDLRRFLGRYRLAGHDLEVDTPRYVPLELALTLCVEPDHFRRIVRDTVLTELGNRVLRDGRRGLFHPDNLTFGQTIYLSPIYTAAQAVPGVASVTITAFRRWGSTGETEIRDGRLALGRLEVPRLDNDPTFPERGIITVTMEGGR